MVIVRFLGALVTALPLGAFAQAIALEAPVGGWVHSAGERTGFTQSVHYPASSVNTPERTGRASRIEGRIHTHPKDGNGRPVTLVVNGVPLPQRTDPDGRFSRPYAFPAGSNSVEVRSADARRRVQRFDSNAGRTRPRVRVVLSWDSDNTDLDLHVISPLGTHVFYGDRQDGHGTALDIDVTTGYGPEIVASTLDQAGLWLVYVNYYGGSQDEASPLTVATITVITDEGTPNEKQQSVRVPMRLAGELTLAHQFQYP